MIPQTIAVIPDGNRRWAERRGLPVREGHRQGLLNGRRLVQAAFEKGVRDVVLWGASWSNLHERSPLEVQGLLKLLEIELRERLRRTDSVKFLLRGDWQEFTKDPLIPELAKKVEEHTKNCDERRLTVLFGYDGERDNEQAVQQLFDKGVSPTRELIRSKMWDAHVPFVDLIIRTGVEGDPHDSEAFLPWKRKNAQLVFSPLLSPDFGEKELNEVLEEFNNRPRRMGS